MSQKDFTYAGGISRNYAKKTILKITLGYIIFYALPSILTYWLIYYFESPSFTFDLFLWLTIYSVLLPYGIVLIFSIWYLYKYVKQYSFEVSENNIIIRHGVFTKKRVTIPYTRVQNINIANGIFDRLFKIYTVKVETAGASGTGGGGGGGYVRPEGLIPGLEDPYIIENKIKEMMTKYSQIPSGLEDKIFKPEELAFDNFISYILSKMREGEYLKTTIKEKRENANMTAVVLAEKVGVPIQTINYLEEGRYNPSLALALKISEVLKCKIEDLFKLSE
ncbi:MAG: PH domain-containing protein [Promethearchaeota archaeon]|nr:MAG: PH domain-containing protein [Candidatus Lokiarchaeota archaeon]